jgi:peptidyl-prolyl cis-trans isomerase C
MKRLHQLLLGTTIALGVVAGSSSAFAQATKTPENKTLVIVNGHKITTKEVKLAADDILTSLQEVPPKLRYTFIIDYLIERRLLAQQAVREGLGESNEYKTRLFFYQAKALRDAYFIEKIRAKITDEEVRRVYDEQAKTIPPVTRYRARHILVGTEQEAKSILAKLQNGENFENLAKAFSLDGSKDFGGDLGYFTAAEMVDQFAAALKKLKKGETSQPVKTEFGWHIIRLEDSKTGGPVPYEKVKVPIKLVLLRQAVQDKVKELREKAKIEMVDPDLKKMLSAARKKRKELEAARAKRDLQNPQKSAPAN